MFIVDNLLILITLGIYAFWAAPKCLAWVADNARYR